MDVFLFVPSLLGLFASMGLLAFGVKTLRKGRKRSLPPPKAPAPEKKANPVEPLRQVAEWQDGKNRKEKT